MVRNCRVFQDLRGEAAERWTGEFGLNEANPLLEKNLTHGQDTLQALFLAVIFGPLGDKRPQQIEVLHVNSRIDIGSLQDKSRVREPGMAGHTSQRWLTDVALADVPMTVNSGIVFGAGVVEMNRSNIFRLNGFLNLLDQRFKTVLLAQIIAGREGVSCIEAHT